MFGANKTYYLGRQRPASVTLSIRDRRWRSVIKAGVAVSTNLGTSSVSQSNIFLLNILSIASIFHHFPIQNFKKWNSIYVQHWVVSMFILKPHFLIRNLSKNMKRVDLIFTKTVTYIVYCLRHTDKLSNISKYIQSMGPS